MSLDLSDVPAELREPVAAALAAAGVGDGHLAVELVDASRIRELNREHRGKDAPTDVLAFPIDGAGPAPGPRELGDVAICPEHCSDVTEAAVHGVLHLCGYDHEADEGEMLALQAQGAGGPGVTRSGFVGLAGRPNVGKSTLVNQIVGSRVAIVSMRPQTTRRAIRGIHTDVEAGRQLVLVDLPGVQRPRDVLTERMQKRVERELADSDLALIVINGEEGVGPGDRFIARALLGAGAKLPTICAVNKVDRLGPNELVPVLAEAAELGGVDEVFPISARSGEGVDALVERHGRADARGPLPLSAGGPQRPVERAAAGRADPRAGAQPHPRRDPALGRGHGQGGRASARTAWSPSTPRSGPRPSRRSGILIGKGGAKVGEIGTGARRSLEAELGAKVHLDLKIRVRSHWRRDEDLLDRLGIE